MEGVEFVSDESVLGVQTTLVEGYSSVQIIEDVFEEGRVFGVGLNIEVFVVKLLRYFLEMFFLERLTAIADKNIAVILELPVKDQNNKFMTNPILIPHQIKLLILPLDQTAIIFPFLHIISLQFD